MKIQLIERFIRVSHDNLFEIGHRKRTIDLDFLPQGDLP